VGGSLLNKSPSLVAVQWKSQIINLKDLLRTSKHLGCFQHMHFVPNVLSRLTEFRSPSPSKHLLFFRVETLLWTASSCFLLAVTLCLALLFLLYLSLFYIRFLLLVAYHFPSLNSTFSLPLIVFIFVIFNVFSFFLSLLLDSSRVVLSAFVMNRFK
jgi:hypothetical protein